MRDAFVWMGTWVFTYIFFADLGFGYVIEFFYEWIHKNLEIEIPWIHCIKENGYTLTLIIIRHWTTNGTFHLLKNIKFLQTQFMRACILWCSGIICSKYATLDWQTRAFLDLIRQLHIQPDHNLHTRRNWHSNPARINYTTASILVDITRKSSIEYHDPTNYVGWSCKGTDVHTYYNSITKPIPHLVTQNNIVNIAIPPIMLADIINLQMHISNVTVSPNWFLSWLPRTTLWILLGHN